MGATDSKFAGPGVITVAAGPAPASSQDVALAQHLQSLREKVPKLQEHISRGDPEEVWRDMEAAKALEGRTAPLEAGIADLLGGYQAWHSDQTAPIIANQAYVHRLVDQADIKAAKAVQHVKQQTAHLRALTAQLQPLQGAALQLQGLCSQMTRLHEQCQLLEREAHAQRQQ